jgi:nucleoside-diphosphate-sugar epimerase
MNNAKTVVNNDLNYICNNLQKEFSYLAGKKLLITGGAGFLGYYLVQSILYRNKFTDTHRQIELTIYDNFIRGIPKWLTDLNNCKNLTVVRHDITGPLPKNINDFQYIIHAASIASPTYYRKNPIKTMDANVNGLRFLLEYSCLQAEKGKPIDGLLFYSTSEIYGGPQSEHIPTPETYNGNVSCTGPRACYDESKRYGETLCVNFALQYNLPIKIVRPFNNYGPGLKITDQRVIPNFARNILMNQDIILFSDGSETRTFCYVADAIIGYYKTLVKGHSGEPYNIGVEAPEISIFNLAKRLVKTARELFGYQGNIIRQTSSDKNFLVDNPNRRCPMILKAKTELGYNPEVSLNEGLYRTLIWYQDNSQDISVVEDT